METDLILSAYTVRRNPPEVYDHEHRRFVPFKTDEERIRILKNNERLQARCPRVQRSPEEIEVIRKILNGEE